MARARLEGSARQALGQGGWILGLTFGMSFAVNLLRLAGPLFVILIYDRVLPARSQETLLALFAVLVVLIGVQGLADYARKRLLARFGAQFQERLETLLFAATPQSAMFDPGRSKPTAGLDELDGLRAFFHSSSLVAVFDFFWTPMFVAVIFILHPLLGWLCVAGMVVMLVLSLIQMAFMGERQARSYEASRGIAELKTMVAASREVVRGQEMVKGFKGRWLAARIESRDRAIALKDWTVWFDNLSGIAVSLMRYGVLATGAWLTIGESLTIGAMVAATFLVSRVMSPVDRFMGELPVMVEAFRHWGRLNRILADHSAEAAEKGVGVGNARLRLSLEGVWAKAPNTGISILRGITLDIAPGAMVQINAASGKGKSVLAQVIAGLWRRSAGTILIDGLNIDQLSDDDSARLFGYVPDVSSFVAGTLEENIAHLDLSPDPEAVASAARRACLHAVISALPEGYQTRIEPSGAPLSRGQRYQLALARALYRNPAILILDEPDAAMLETIPETLDKTFNRHLKSGGIVVALSRKPLTLSQIGISYRLEGGKLVEVKPRAAAKPRVVAIEGGMPDMAPRAKPLPEAGQSKAGR